MEHPISYHKPGDKLGKYEIKSLLGRGGMAEVYRALNPDLGQDVAIKVLHPHAVDEDAGVTRFRHEASAIAGLSHAHIIRVFDFDVQRGTYYMVMELIEGGTLADYLKQLHKQGKQMSLDQVVTFFSQLVDAVGY